VSSDLHPIVSLTISPHYRHPRVILAVLDAGRSELFFGRESVTLCLHLLLDLRPGELASAARCQADACQLDCLANSLSSGSFFAAI
jgi:hypothetical protein